MFCLDEKNEKGRKLARKHKDVTEARGRVREGLRGKLRTVAATLGRSNRRLARS
jgi:hypothetical protein